MQIPLLLGLRKEDRLGIDICLSYFSKVFFTFSANRIALHLVNGALRQSVVTSIHKRIVPRWNMHVCSALCRHGKMGTRTSGTNDWLFCHRRTYRLDGLQHRLECFLNANAAHGLEAASASNKASCRTVQNEWRGNSSAHCGIVHRKSKIPSR